jgi:hypothetical protein
MGPSGLEMGVGGDLGLRGDLLSRTLPVPGVRVFIWERQDMCGREMI